MPALPMGFTVVELLVVISVIVLILALAVPNLSALHADTRLKTASQTINAMMTRAYFLSLAEQTMTAVRFMPAEWDASGDETGKRGRQRVVIYKYVSSSDVEVSGVFQVQFEEYFQRVDGIQSAELPIDVWVAPLEALSNQRVVLGGIETVDKIGPDFVLNGDIHDATTGEHYFVLNTDRATGPAEADTFLNADDFLIVFDPQTGLRADVRKPYPLKAFDPRPRVVVATGETETSGERNGSGMIIESRRYQRYGFTGLVLYRREAFVALGSQADGADRQEWLRAEGSPYLAHPLSGGLISAMQGQQEDG